MYQIILDNRLLGHISQYFLIIIIDNEKKCIVLFLLIAE